MGMVIEEVIDPIIDRQAETHRQTDTFITILFFPVGNEFSME